MNKLLIIFFILLPSFLMSQNSYFIKDSVKKSNIVLVNGKAIENSKFCQFRDKGRTIKYTPNEVMEYKLSNGDVYISKEVDLDDSLQRVFLLQLYDGERNALYYLKREHKQFFYIQKEGADLIVLSSEDKHNNYFKRKLEELTNDCKAVNNNIRFVGFNRASLSRFVKTYDRCELKYFPHFRFGITGGYEMTKLVINHEKFDRFDFQYNGGFAIGLFVDYPIGSSDLSVHPELYYTSHAFYYSVSPHKNSEYDLFASISTFKFPVLFRYTIPHYRFRPFINLGVMAAYNTCYESTYIHYVRHDSSVYINSEDITELLDGLFYGFSVGLGMEFSLTKRNSLFTEVRFNGLEHSKMHFVTNSDFNFIIAINF